MDPLTLAALNTYQESGGEIDDGKAAVARVVKNRMALNFFSDGTIPGTVLAKDQFSWAWFHFVTMVTGTVSAPKHVQIYQRAAKNVAEASAIADKLLKTVPARAFQHCYDITAQVMAGTYVGTDILPGTGHSSYDLMTDKVVSYLNPKILTRLPRWAIPEAEVCVIGRHHFYREAAKPTAMV